MPRPKRQPPPPANSGKGGGLFLLLLAAYFYAILGGFFKGEAGNLFLALTGGLFLALFLLARLDWAVYPGSFLLASGLAVYMASLEVNLDVYWPLFILFPGLGFLLILLLTPQNRWALLPGALTILAALFFFAVNFGLLPESSSLYITYLPPVLFLVWGLKLILFPRK
jgi:hypothetical protein